MEFLMTLAKCVWLFAGIAFGFVILYAIISVPFNKRRKEKFTEELLTDLSNELVATFKESMKAKETKKEEEPKPKRKTTKKK